MEYADNLTHIDIKKGEEEPASEAQKNKVKSFYLEKWMKSYETKENLLRILSAVGIIEKSFDFAVTAENMAKIMKDLEIPSDYVEEKPFASLRTRRSKVDGPLPEDRNLTELGDYNE